MNSVSITASSAGAGGYVELRLNSIDGELIGSVDIPNTGGWDIWEPFTANIERVAGENDLYLVFKGSGAWLYNIDYFGFSEEVICDVEAEWIEAECYDQMSGIQTENCSEGSRNVGWIHNGDWLMFSNVDLLGMNSIKARVASQSVGNYIEVHLDSEDGELIGELEVSNTGGNQNWVTDSVNIESVDGTRDVYLVFRGGAGYLFNINNFTFSDERAVVTGLESNSLLQNLAIYPNPTDGLIYFNEEFTYELFDIYGHLLIEGDGESLDLTAFQSGTYLLKTDQGISRVVKN